MSDGPGSMTDGESSASVVGGPTIGGPMIGGPMIGGPMIGGPMIDEHCHGIPAEPLRRYVARYTGYRQRGLPPARHRGLPSPYLTLIFTLDEPLTIAAHPDPGQPPGEFGTLLGGLERPPPHQPVPRRHRPDAEGRRPGHPLRPGPAAAGAQARGRERRLPAR